MSLISLTRASDNKISPVSITANTACAGMERSNNNALTSTLVSKTTRILIFEQVFQNFRRQAALLCRSADLTYHLFQWFVNAGNFQQTQAQQQLHFFTFLRASFTIRLCCFR